MVSFSLLEPVMTAVNQYMPFRPGWMRFYITMNDVNPYPLETIPCDIGHSICLATSFGVSNWTRKPFPGRLPLSKALPKAHKIAPSICRVPAIVFQERVNLAIDWNIHTGIPLCSIRYQETPQLSTPYTASSCVNFS